jgi:4-hydroxy-4-methyl-2-oxoglutarate aldolase
MHYALMTAQPGTVMVCAANGLVDCGYFGELAGIDAQNRGLVGLVIDGSIRDAGDLERLRFPVFYAGTAPSTCAKKTLESLGEPIVVRGVTINPGDQIVADRDAIVVVPADRWSDVQEAARAVHTREDAMRARLREGERLSTMIPLPADALDIAGASQQ